MEDINSFLDADNEYIQQLAEGLIIESDNVLENSINFKWHFIKLIPFNQRYYAIDFDEWIKNNCIDECRRYGLTFAFKNIQDASLFSIKWL